MKTPAGIITRYAYWPDGTRRSATTASGGVDHTITYHYTTAGQLANDTYTGAAAGAWRPGHRHRLLPAGGQPRGPHPLDTAGTGPATIQATGPGTGYYLTDAHGSVTAMIDARAGHRQLRLR